MEPVCKACKLKHRQEYVAQYPERARNAELKYLNGLTLEQYHAMLAAQEGWCAICGTAEEKLVVDHNHATGRVRSLLCHLCNAMIGCARESSDILIRAAAYLYAEQHPELGRVRAEVHM
ncbi:MAG TPA: endonuclease VII domain-containing protein [Ktedonobacterales bacterium]|nr:endonuclease VII domain-containing protein [Ktedonobacterales bacterium]